MSGRKFIFIIGSILVILSMLMPWIDMEPYVKLLGYETNGFFIGIIGIAAFAFALVYKNNEKVETYVKISVVGSLLELGLTVYFYYQYLKTCVDEFVRGSENMGAMLHMCSIGAGIGIFVAFLGGIFLLIGATFPNALIPKEKK